MGDKVHSKDEVLEDRFDNIGWGLLFLLVGALAIPTGTAQFVAAIAVGAAMLGLNVIRAFMFMPVRWFTIILGTVMVMAGVGALGGVHMDVFVLFFVVLGVVTIGAAVIGPTRAKAS